MPPELIADDHSYPALRLLAVEVCQPKASPEFSLTAWL
jgi:hypothetical protein